MGQQRQQESGMLFQSGEEAFNFTYRLTSFGSSFIRPVFYHGQGTRAYDKGTLLAFITLPLLAEFTRSGAMTVYWKLWLVMLVIRWLFPDRSQSTGYWGGIRLVEWVSFGKVTVQRFLEVIFVGGIAWSVSIYSVALSRLMYFGAGCMLYQYRLGFELMRREKEAIHNAHIAASRYR